MDSPSADERREGGRQEEAARSGETSSRVQTFSNTAPLTRHFRARICCHFGSDGSRGSVNLKLESRFKVAPLFFCSKKGFALPREGQQL